MKLKLNLFFKTMLFTFLCFLVCVIAYTVTGIDVIAPISGWFLLASYCSLVAWICSKVAKCKRFGINLSVVTAFFGIALYFGIRLAWYDEFATINNFDLISLDGLIFVAASMLCLLSVIVLLARCFFGNTEKKENETVYVEKPQTYAWICTCGCGNNGKFCSECGAAPVQPAAAEPNKEEAPASAEE